jgi:hypothetical protein
MATNLSQISATYDPMQQWLDEKPEKQHWNTVAYHAKEEQSQSGRTQTEAVSIENSVY